MTSVPLDVFSMPQVHVRKGVFDGLVLCVDRHHGYIVAMPVCKKGFFAKRMAITMVGQHLTIFGVSLTMDNNPRPSLMGCLLKTMYRLIRVMHAKSVAPFGRSIGQRWRQRWPGDSLFKSYAKYILSTSGEIDSQTSCQSETGG